METRGAIERGVLNVDDPAGVPLPPPSTMPPPASSPDGGGSAAAGRSSANAACGPDRCAETPAAPAAASAADAAAGDAGGDSRIVAGGCPTRERTELAAESGSEAPPAEAGSPTEAKKDCRIDVFRGINGRCGSPGLSEVLWVDRGREGLAGWVSQGGSKWCRLNEDWWLFTAVLCRREGARDHVGGIGSIAKTGVPSWSAE